MLTLASKDGTKTGNAIIYGSEDHPELGVVFLVETDFGNRMRLTWREIDEWFTPMRTCPYEVWNADRQALRDSNRQTDLEDAIRGQNEQDIFNPPHMAKMSG